MSAAVPPAAAPAPLLQVRDLSVLFPARRGRAPVRAVERLSFDIAPMQGPDFSAPRGMGAFVLAIKPDAFIEWYRKNEK